MRVNSNFQSDSEEWWIGHFILSLTTSCSCRLCVAMWRCFVDKMFYWCIAQVGCDCMAMEADELSQRFRMIFRDTVSKFGRWTSILWDEVRWEGGRGRKEGRKIGNIEENGKAASPARRLPASPGLDGRMGYMRNHKGGSKNWHYHACCAIQHRAFEVSLDKGKCTWETHSKIVLYPW